MDQSIKNFINSCLLCQAKSSHGLHKAPIQSFPDIKAPLEYVAVDIVGPLSTTSRHNKYMFTVIDMFSRFAQVYAIPNIKTETLIQCLSSYFSTFGPVAHILSDAGSQFNSSEYRVFLADYNTQIHLTMPFNHQANGLCERYHKTLKQLLQNIEDKNPTEWDNFLETATFALNATFHESIQNIPFYLFYGRQANLNISLLFNNNLTREVDPTVNPVSQRIERLNIVFQNAFEASKNSHDRNVKYQKLHKQSTFEVGQIVMLSNNYRVGTNAKYKPKFLGPYRITKKLSPVNRELLPILPFKGKSKLVHINRLKPATIRNFEWRGTEVFPLQQLTADESPDDETNADNDISNQPSISNDPPKPQNSQSIALKEPVITTDNMASQSVPTSTFIPQIQYNNNGIQNPFLRPYGLRSRRDLNIPNDEWVQSRTMEFKRRNK
ncbi:unnamed protein product [Rotaria socialis]|nr:unnamed protein product [Rotaria socialis]